MAGRSKNIPKSTTVPKSARFDLLPMTHSSLSSLKQIGVSSGGLGLFNPPYRIYRNKDFHRHVVLFTVSGTAEWGSNEKRFMLQAGDLWIGPSFSLHQYWSVKDWQLMWFHLDDLPRWGPLKRLELKSRPAHYLAELVHPFTRIIAESINKGPETDSLLRSYSEILSILLQKELNGLLNMAEYDSRSKLQELWQAVSEDFSYPWTIQDLCNKVSMSRGTLFRTVHHFEGMGPMERVQELRLKKAAELLKQTVFKLEQIASMVGYANAFALSRAFSKRFKVTPKVYRRGLIENSTKPVT